MKNIIIQTVIVLSSVLIGCNSMSIAEDIRIYNKQKIRHNNIAFNPGSKFYLFNNAYPKSIKEYIERVEPDSFGLEYFKREMIDPFLKEGEIIRYYPLYADTTLNPVACIFLSVGEDGALNNVINTKLQLHNWYESIKAYNIEEVKNEIKKIEIRYPVYNRRTGQKSRYIIHVDESELLNGYITLKGDRLFTDTFKYGSLCSYSNPEIPFIYPEFSKQRKLTGKKDYIVGWGCRVIEYEILK